MGKHCKLPTVPSQKWQPVAKVGGDQIHSVPMIFNVGGARPTGLTGWLHTRTDLEYSSYGGVEYVPAHRTVQRYHAHLDLARRRHALLAVNTNSLRRAVNKRIHRVK